MIATLTPTHPVPFQLRPGTENLFRRLDGDGNGQLTVADRVSVVISLSPLSLARYAATQTRPAGDPPSRLPA